MPVMLAGPAIEQTAESRNPVFAVVSRRPRHRFCESDLAETFDLLFSAQFLDSEVERMGGMRIDRTADIRARPSIAAAVKPPRPPPTIATSVYRMDQVQPLGHHHGPDKGK
jgi:hypothetical protein